MRLVKTRATTLTEAQTAKLMDLVKRSADKDSNFFKLCNDMRDLLKGRHWDKLRGKEQRKMAELVINLAHSHVRSMVPGLFFREPHFEAQADNIQYKDSAPTWGALLNAVVGKTKYKEQTKKVVYDAVVYPEGWKKWVIVKDTSNPEIEIGTTDLIGKESQGGERTETGSSGPGYTTYGQPVGVRLAPHQVIVDYNSPDRSLDDARFVAIRYRKLISEVKADPRYTLNKDWKVKDEDGVKTATVIQDSRDSIPDYFDDDVSAQGDDEYVTLYEVWVYQLVELKLYRQLVVLVEGHPTPIRALHGWEEFIGPYVKGYPITRLVLNPTPDDLPEGELSSWKGMQRALNWLVSRLMSFVENDKDLYTYRVSGLANPTKAKTAFYKGGPKELIEVTEDGVINPVPKQNSSRDSYQLIQIMLTLIQQVSGYGQNRRGGIGARTATEASIVQANTQIRDDDKTDTISEFCKADGEILVGLLRTTASKDFVFRALGDVGGVRWQQFTEFDGSWSPDVSIRANSFKKAVMAEEAQKYGQALAVGTNLFQVYGPKVRLDILYERFLKSLEIPRTSEIIGSTIPEEIMQMTEIVRAVTGQPIVVNMADNHVVHRAVLMDYISSPDYDNLPTTAKQEIEEHLRQHEEAIATITAQTQKMKPTTGDSAFGTESSGEQDAATQANEETAMDRTPISPAPKGGKAFG